VAAGGLHRVSGNAIYVSRGLGFERDQAPRIRLFCPPEVGIISILGFQCSVFSTEGPQSNSYGP
jgi:predicted MPP superfamily phosphohydrolase